MPKRAKIERSSEIIPYTQELLTLYGDIAARTTWTWDEKGVYTVLANLQEHKNNRRLKYIDISYPKLSALVGLSENKTRKTCRLLHKQGRIRIEGWDSDAVWIDSKGRTRFGKQVKWRYGKPQAVNVPGQVNYCLDTRFFVLNLEKRKVRRLRHEERAIRENKLVSM